MLFKISKNIVLFFSFDVHTVPPFHGRRSDCCVPHNFVQPISDSSVPSLKNLKKKGGQRYKNKKDDIYMSGIKCFKMRRKEREREREREKNLVHFLNSPFLPPNDTGHRMLWGKSWRG